MANNVIDELPTTTQDMKDAALAEVARLSHAHAAERINWASDRHTIVEDDEPMIGRDYE